MFLKTPIFKTLYFLKMSPIVVGSVHDFGTGKSFSEALILVSTNPQFDKRLFVELRVQYIKIPSSGHVENMLCTQMVFDRDFKSWS